MYTYKNENNYMKIITPFVKTILSPLVLFFGMLLIMLLVTMAIANFICVFIIEICKIYYKLFVCGVYREIQELSQLVWKYLKRGYIFKAFITKVKHAEYNDYIDRGETR